MALSSFESLLISLHHDFSRYFVKNRNVKFGENRRITVDFRLPSNLHSAEFWLQHVPCLPDYMYDLDYKKPKKEDAKQAFKSIYLLEKIVKYQQKFLVEAAKKLDMMG